MTENQFRRIALGMQSAVEGSHMDHPDFRAGGKIFATLHGNQKTGMVRLTPEQQAEFVAGYPQIFAPGPGAWGEQGATYVYLQYANAEVVGEAMTSAWQNVMAAAPPAKRRRTGAATGGAAQPPRNRKSRS